MVQVSACRAGFGPIIAISFRAVAPKAMFGWPIALERARDRIYLRRTWCAEAAVKARLRKSGREEL